MHWKQIVRAVSLAGVATLALPFGAARAAAATSCPTTLTYGATVSCSLDKPTETDAYALSAAAGDALYVHVVGLDGNGLDVDFDVRDPAGTLLCAARAGASAAAFCKVNTTGKQTINVFESGRDETGRYRIDTQRANKPVGSTALAMARPRQASIGSLGENDWFTVTGAADAPVVVRGVALGAAPISVDLDLIAPNGDLLCATRAGVTAQASCTLPTTGTYTVRVGDGGDDQLGVYALTVRPACTINGTTGADMITGTPGPDVICGLAGADVINGGDGADVIIGGTGDDRIDGGKGSDVFLTERTTDGADVYTGGSGTDLLSYAERSGAVVSDANVKPDDGEANERDDVRADVEAVYGGAGSDTMVGGAVNNTFSGGWGNDTLVGGAGNDNLDGGDGDDRCDGGADGAYLVNCERT